MIHLHWIAHRGNLSGPNPARENSPLYLQKAMRAGYEVETDVWWYKQAFYLGHNQPQFKIDHNFLEDHRVWAHAKNLEALVVLLGYPFINCFWHQDDSYTLTSKGFVWTHPKARTILRNQKRQILVMPKRTYQWARFGGVCSDNVQQLRAAYEQEAKK